MLELEQKLLKESKYTALINQTGGKLNNTYLNLQRMMQNLNQHILASQYQQAFNQMGQLHNPKYIDISLDLQLEAHIIGDERPQYMSNTNKIEESDSNSDEERDPNFFDRVPSRFRIQSCQVGVTYIITIRQFNKDKKHAPQQNPGSRQRVTFLSQKRVRCADLNIFISNSTDSPCAKNHDKHITHNNFKTFSKITQFKYYNKAKDDGDDDDAQSDGSNQNGARAPQNIYLTIESEMGCHIKILVETMGRRRQNNTFSLLKQDTFTDNRKIERELKAYLIDN